VVVDTAGRPLSGAEVALSPTPDSDAPFARMSVERAGPDAPEVTDAQGRFSFEHLEPGRFDLQASARGFAPTVVRGIDLAATGAGAGDPAGGPGGRRGPVNLGTVALAPGVTLEGVVVDPQSRPIAGARVSTYSTARISLFQRSARDDDEILTAADGSFSIPDLRAGEKVGLTASKKGYKPARFDQLEVPGSEPLRITLTPGVRIAGRVLTEAGDPVAAVRITVSRVGGNQLAIGASMLSGFARSEEDGAFVFEGIEPGKVRLTANAQGFRKKESADLDLVAGRDVEDFNLVLERGAALVGRVVGADGAPVAGASVQLIEGSSRSAMVGYRFGGSGATTDGDGNYRLEGLDEGSQSFAAQAEDYERAVKDLEIRSGENRLDFRLEPGFDVGGRVVDAGGQPVAGARVQMSAPGAPSFPFGRNEDARSAADGSFRVRGVAAGVYDVQADKEGYAPARRESLQVTGPVQGVELRLEAGGSVHGRLTGLEFNELAGARVYASTQGNTRPTMRYGSVDYQGQYRIDGLTAGEWYVSAHTGSDRQADGHVTVAQGADAVLDLEFGEGLTLTGRIVKGGEPLPNLRVSVSSQEGTGYGSGTSDPQGNFRIEGLKAGTYELQAIDFQTGISHHETLELTADRDILIEISTRRVSGRVVDAQDQSPLRDATVSLEATGDKPGNGMASAIPRGSTSDSAGAFELTEVSPGAYRLRAQKDGYSPADTQVQVGADADVSDLRLALQPTQGLTLQVSSSVGSPPSGVQVAVVDAAGQVKAAGSYATGENGRVRFDTAPPGSWRLLTTAEGSATVGQDVQVPGPPVPVLLYSATRLAVTVPAGAQGTITAIGADGQLFRALGWGGSVRQEWPIREGQTVIDDLPPGRWQIRATSPGGEVWQGVVVTTPAGGTVAIALR
jgi:protocatechuate 3,4-dioxygenase beta subunit